jgi:hypothetical protein
MARSYESNGCAIRAPRPLSLYLRLKYCRMGDVISITWSAAADKLTGCRARRLQKKWGTWPHFFCTP